MQPNIKKIAWIVGGVIILLIIIGIIFSDSSTATVTLDTPSSPTQLAQSNSIVIIPPTSNGNTNSIPVGPVVAGAVQVVEGGKTIVIGVLKGLANFGRKIISTNNVSNR
jgi:hypothetical protein